MQPSHSVLIVAPPGALRRGLQALLHSMASIRSITLAEDGADSLQLVAAQQPDIVLIDLRMLGDEAWTVLRRIKVSSPLTQRIVLADDVRQQEQMAAQAAEGILLKGALPAELVSVVERLLSAPPADVVGE